MSTEEKHTIKGWGHRLREENRSLKEKAARLKKEVRLLQKEVGNAWKLIEGIPGGIVLLQQQKIILANETACRELGYTREEMLTKKLPDIVHPDSAQIAGALQRRTAADQILPGQYEIYLTTKGGQTLCAEVRA
ncbi:MAG: PAS domain-containing protein, partial [Desulfobacteraceae bacterium]|nr:PAS domain-containing protein [Desulfobacteraceae bacterium]